MGIGLDYTSRIAPAALAAVGATVICRYIAPQAWKTINQSEYNELRQSGFTVFLNWESSATDWSGGSGAGTQHGNMASAMARVRGYPPGSIIIGSCDFDANANSVRPYAQAFKRAVNNGGYGAGVYGPYNVLSMCQQEGYSFFWQCMSTGFAGNSKLHPATNLWQKGHRTVGGQDCDWSQIINISGGNMAASNDDILAAANASLHFLQRAFNGFPDAGTPYANLVGAWVGQDQASQATILAKLVELKADVDALKAAAGTGSVDVVALAAALAPHLPHHITGDVS